METASDVWQHLKKRYHQGDLFRIAELQESLYSFRQGDLSVTAYFTQMQGIWQELENYRPLPQCKCSTPRQGVPTFQKYHDSDYVIQLLRGLNDQLSGVCLNIMMLDPLPDVDKVFALLVQEERQMQQPIEDSKMISNLNLVHHQKALLVASHFRTSRTVLILLKMIMSKLLKILLMMLQQTPLLLLQVSAKPYWLYCRSHLHSIISPVTS